jgi:predicted transcriptional regulator
MATKQQKIEIARALYIVGRNEEEIAAILGSSKRTVQNYKTEDSSSGYDWDVLRAEKHISADNPRREHLYSDFIGYMHDTLKEVRNDEKISASDKADKIVKLSDAFSKMKGIVRHEDPEAYKRGIIKHVVQVIGEGIRSRGDKAMLERFIEIVDEAGERLDVAI